jgi:hypothetical protein
MQKKRHIEYGGHLEFLRKTIFYKNYVFRQAKKIDKRRFVGLRNKSNLSGHIE